MASEQQKNKYSYNTDQPIESPHLNAHKMRIISTPDKGRGVFATQPIASGKVIEISPVLLFTKEEYTQHGKHTALDDYTFVWPDRSGRMGLAMGIGSMFNHHKYPNVSYSISTHTLTITFTTTRYIDINDELCISYGPESKLWWRNSKQVEDDVDDEVKDMSELSLLQCNYGS